MGQVRFFARVGKGAFLAVIVFSLIVNLLMLTGPLFMLQIYDRVLTSGSVPTLVALAGLVVLLYALYGLLEFVRSRIMVRAGANLEAGLRERAFNAVTRSASSGDTSIRTVPLTDLSQIRQFLSGPGPFAFLDAPWTPIYLFAIWLMHPTLGLASVIAVAILIVMAVINNVITRRANAASGQAFHAANAASEEARKNAEVTTALGMNAPVRQRWSGVQEQAMSHLMTASDRSGAISALSRAMRLAFQSGILGLGAWLAIRQEISPGAMIAASIIMSRALAPVEQLVAHWQGFLNVRQAWARLTTVLNEMPEREDGVQLPRPDGNLSVEGLIAKKPGSAKPQLAGVTFDLEPGDGLGVIGPTGAGKTTLARVLVGVSPHYAGAVRLDGAEIRQYPEDVLGGAVGYLPQDVELFEGTIGQNIARFRADAPDADIITAAKQANVHELVLKFTDGYDTKLGEGGASLSAGQRQRIGLARALFGGPSLIVLDEPNANLDSEGEAAVVDAVHNARKRGATVIIIAHRPSAIAALNKLMMLKDSRMVAFGPKEEVLDKVIQKPAGNKKPALPPSLTMSGTLGGRRS